jgi:hypothetical protein
MSEDNVVTIIALVLALLPVMVIVLVVVIYFLNKEEIKKDWEKRIIDGAKMYIRHRTYFICYER